MKVKTGSLYSELLKSFTEALEYLEEIASMDPGD